MVLAVPRFYADIVDMPANQAAQKLDRGKSLAPRYVKAVVKTRRNSLLVHDTPVRRFQLARALWQRGDVANAANAFEDGLRQAPAGGENWAIYARLLRQAGKERRSELARQHSVRRAPHDPDARRWRVR